MINCRCIDQQCAQYGELFIVKNRRQILEHVHKKKTYRLVEVLSEFYIINNFSILTRYSIVNIFADCCYERTAREFITKGL